MLDYQDEPFDEEEKRKIEAIRTVEDSLAQAKVHSKDTETARAMIERARTLMTDTLDEIDQRSNAPGCSFHL